MSSEGYEWDVESTFRQLSLVGSYILYITVIPGGKPRAYRGTDHKAESSEVTASWGAESDLWGRWGLCLKEMVQVLLILRWCDSSMPYGAVDRHGPLHTQTYVCRSCKCLSWFILPARMTELRTNTGF